MSEDNNPPRGRPFVPGQSGNPNGRPRGSRNRSTFLAQGLLDDTAEELLAKVREMALAGDRTILSLFLKHLLPRERLLSFDLPEIRTAADIDTVTQQLLDQVARSEITLEEAERVRDLLSFRLKTLQEREFEQRISNLELEHIFGEG